MLEAASSFGYRLIAPNRRLYPGSTPYTKEEMEAFEPSNSPEDIVGAYIKQGGYLLSFVDNMIQEHNLKKVVVTGWSLGSGFLSAMVCSMSTVTADVKVRLRHHIKGLNWWGMYQSRVKIRFTLMHVLSDPPSPVHGLPDPPSGGWIPLYDEELVPELRGRAFVEWVTQYFPHPDMDEKDYTNLIYKNTTQTKPATYSDLSDDKMFSMLDITAGPRGDNFIAGDPSFQRAGQILFERTFLNEGTRKQWENIPFSVIYGEEAPWPVVWAVWELEARSETAGLPVRIRGIAGANHFVRFQRPFTSFLRLYRIVYSLCTTTSLGFLKPCRHAYEVARGILPTTVELHSCWNGLNSTFIQ